MSDFFPSEIRSARYKQWFCNLSGLTNNNCPTILQHKMSTTPQQLREEAINILETIEDTVEYLCDENLLSGEKVWVMIHALSESKMEEFPLDDDYDA